MMLATDYLSPVEHKPIPLLFIATSIPTALELDKLEGFNKCLHNFPLSPPPAPPKYLPSNPSHVPHSS